MSDLFNKKFDNIFDTLNNFQNEIENLKPGSDVHHKFQDIHSSLLKEINEILKTPFAVAFSEIQEDRLKVWKRIGGGAFGEILITPEPLALKRIERETEKGKQENIHEKILEEIKTLSILNHDNIVSYRGWGKLVEDGNNYVYCLAMEYIDKNLKEYIMQHEVDGAKGLSSRITWEIGKQVAKGLKYLHSLDITHNDIKPDNILIDTKPVTPHAKLCDFGLAGHSYGSVSKKKMSQEEFLQKFPNLEKEVKLGHIRFNYYMKEDSTSLSKEQLKLNDIFAYACVILNCKSGHKPFDSIPTGELTASSIKINHNWNVISPRNGKAFLREVELPSEVKGTELEELIVLCFNAPQEDMIVVKESVITNENLKEQRIATIQAITERFFKKVNPYTLSEKADFFTCGFLTETHILVADSFTPEPEENGLLDQNKITYKRDNLICEVWVPYDSNGDVTLPFLCYPNNEKKEKEFLDNLEKFGKMAREKRIDDNPMLALKMLVTSRPGEEEEQRVELRFMESRYCKHRAMRDIWKSLENEEKLEITPHLVEVNKIFSTSFGLHVAILTNEGPGKPQKFVFAKRSNNTGVASPGSFTCGAVESCSVKDYLTGENLKRHLDFLNNVDRTESFNPGEFFEGELCSEDEILTDGKVPIDRKNYRYIRKYVSLLDTAVRGIEEELGLKLYGSDKDAVMLNTLYLKFDNHEWGLCGFVDLTNPKVRKENRFSFSELMSAFSAGPKDKFEHGGIEGVDFELETMVSWIRENHNFLASSAKIVVVKVLKAFFEPSAVDKAFCAISV